METKFIATIKFTSKDPFTGNDFQSCAESSHDTFKQAKSAIDVKLQTLSSNGVKDITWNIDEVTRSEVSSSSDSVRYIGTASIDGKRKSFRFDSPVKLLDYLDTLLVDSDVNCTFFSVRKIDPKDV